MGSVPGGAFPSQTSTRLTSTVPASPACLARLAGGLSVAGPKRVTRLAVRAGRPGRARSATLRHVFADGGYAGDKLRAALADKGHWTLEIINRSDKAKGFEVLPRRWVVERTFAWLGRCRRRARDWEKTIASATAFLMIAHVRLLTRRIARHCHA